MSEEQVLSAEQAVVQEPAVPSTEEQNQSTEPATEEQQQETEQQTEEQAAEEQQRKRAGGWQRKIEKQNRMISEQERQIAYLKGRLGDVPDEPAKHLESAQSDRPTRDKFGNEDDFHIALGRWGAREELAQREQREAAKPLFEAIARYADEVEDFHEVVQPFLTTERRTPFVEAYLNDPTIGPQFAYHLATNPDELAKLNALGPLELGEFVVGLKPRFLKSAASEPAKPTVSKAPKPPSPVKPTGSGSTKDPSEITDMDEWRAYRLKMNPDYDRA